MMKQAINIRIDTAISIDGTDFISNIKTNQNGLVSYQYADGTTHTREYDTNGRVTKLLYPNYTEEVNYNVVSNITAITADSIKKSFGFDGGVNGFGYVGGMPIISRDNLGLSTYIIANLNSGWIFGWGGTHMGLIVINDNQAYGDKSFLFDPSGSYSPKATWGSQMWMGSGRIQYHDPDVPINISDYYGYQLEDGSDVNIYHFNTTESDEEILLRESEKWGGGSGFDCTTSISCIIKIEIESSKLSLKEKGKSFEPKALK